jgi:hypothetical protein
MENSSWPCFLDFPWACLLWFRKTVLSWGPTEVKLCLWQEPLSPSDFPQGNRLPQRVVGLLLPPTSLFLEMISGFGLGIHVPGILAITKHSFPC